jgi:hypothetical protein
MFTRNDIQARIAAVWSAVQSSMYAEVDKVKTDLVIKVPMTLWGAWESLSVLFPSGLLNPVIGATVFGTGSDLPLVLTARNGDQLTIVNAQITKLANLYLGVDADLFAADVEFTGLLAAGSNPEDSASYYTTGVSQTFTETAFAKTNFKRVRFSGAWGAVTGFTAIIPQKGFQVAWACDLKPLKVDGLGTVDFTNCGVMVSAKCIPIQPTMAQLKTNLQSEAAHGTLLSTIAADLTLTGNGGAPVVVVKNASLGEGGLAFGQEVLRMGEVAWNTTRKFTTGVAQAVATVA